MLYQQIVRKESVNFDTRLIFSSLKLSSARRNPTFVCYKSSTCTKQLRLVSKLVKAVAQSCSWRVTLRPINQSYF